MKKLLDLLRRSVSPQAKQNNANQSTESSSRPHPEKDEVDANSEVMPGRLFDYYGRVLYRPTDLTERLK